MRGFSRDDGVGSSRKGCCRDIGLGGFLGHCGLLRYRGFSRQLGCGQGIGSSILDEQFLNGRQLIYDNGIQFGCVGRQCGRGRLCRVCGQGYLGHIAGQRLRLLLTRVLRKIKPREYA